MDFQIPTAIKNLAKQQGERSRLDVIRGKVSKEGRSYPGLLQQQHPQFLCVPIWSERALAVARYLPREVQSPADERVARALIDSTWNFGKSSEFVSWKHFLHGKFSSESGEMLLAPANVAGSTLSRCLRQLEMSGMFYALRLDLLGKARTLFVPNPLRIRKGFMLGRYPEVELYGSRCTYSEVVGEITLMSEPLSAVCEPTEDIRQTAFMQRLAHELPYPERIAMIFLFSPGSLTDLVLERSQLRCEIENHLVNGGACLKPKIPEEFNVRIKALEDKQEAWFEEPEVQAMILRLGAVNCMHCDKAVSAVTWEEPLAAELLLHRWGYVLSVLSPSVWKVLWNSRDVLPEQNVEALEAIENFTRGTWMGELH